MPETRASYRKPFTDLGFRTAYLPQNCLELKCSQPRTRETGEILVEPPAEHGLVPYFQLILCYSSAELRKLNEAFRDSP